MSYLTRKLRHNINLINHIKKVKNYNKSNRKPRYDNLNHR